MIAEFESRILALIDNMVDHASDDELFAGGYLRGHLTLAVAELEGEGEHSADVVHSRVSQSPEKAISAGELSPPDQILVQGMWHNLYQQAKKSGLSHVVARSGVSRTREIACPHGFISPLFLQQFSHPQPIRIQRRPVSLSSGSGSVLICAASSSALNGAVQSPRDPSAPSINRLRQTGALSAISGCSWRLAYCVNVAA